MKIIKFIFISIFTFLIISCGGSSSEVEFVQIFSDSNIHSEEDLKNFDYGGYSFNSELSHLDNWVFNRDWLCCLYFD